MPFKLTKGPFLKQPQGFAEGSLNHGDIFQMVGVYSWDAERGKAGKNYFSVK